jgi:cytochrome b
MNRGVIRVWDLPTRLFHWALLIVVSGLFATALIPGAPLEWHVRLGYTALTLLLFRLAWGFVGGHWSRFRTFVPSLREVVDDARGRAGPQHLVGHSPLGALSVFAMLLVLLAQVSTGLISDDEIAFTGPLNRLVSNSTGLAAMAYHQGPGKWLVIALIVLHIGAVLFYLLVRKRNLIAPMVHGDKQVAHAVPTSTDSVRSRVGALSLLALSAVVVVLVVRSGGG